jgi:hypothetical protein
MEDQLVTLRDLDSLVIANASPSAIVGLHDTSRYFRELINDPGTFLQFKERYPHTIATSFRDFIRLQIELQRVHRSSNLYTKDLSVGDRVILIKQNYKVNTILGSSGATIVPCDWLGISTANGSSLEIEYRHGTWSSPDMNVFIQPGILKHRNGPLITSLDSPYLLYETYIGPRLGTPSELSTNLVVCVIFSRRLALSYVVSQTDPLIELSYIGSIKELFDGSIPPKTIIFFQEDDIWKSSLGVHVELHLGDGLEYQYRN